MFSPHKNSYLQCRSSGINPRLINRAVNLARNSSIPIDQLDSSDFGPPFLRLTSEQPFHPACRADVTRRPLAFGIEPQVRKLITELASKDPRVLLAALTSLYDVLHDPEKGCIALKLHIINRLSDLLERQSEVIRERTCCVLNVLANAASGKELIMKIPGLVSNLRNALNDVDQFVRLKSALVVSTISSYWLTADMLIDGYFIPTILQCIRKYDHHILPTLLDALNNLMYNSEGKHLAYQHNAFPSLLNLISTQDDESILVRSLEGIAVLLQLPDCMRRALDDDIDLLDKLDSMLTCENPDVHNAAAKAIMFATIKMRAKMSMERFLSMPKRLIQLAGNCQNESSQIFALKALTNICDYPPLRMLVYNSYIKQINDIPVRNADIMKYKETLLSIATNVSNLGQVIYNIG